MNLKWSEGNSKMKRTGVLAFGIPAFKSADGFKTCPGAGACAAVCYARQGFYVMPNVAAAREYNLAIMRGSLDDFECKLLDDLHELDAPIIRVHDSGDFWSQAYLNVWVRTARAYPGKTFYAYTKSLHLDFSGLPKNLSIIQSEGGAMDDRIDARQPHARIFSTHYARRKAGYVDASQTDLHAIRGTRKIGFVYHGSRKMTPAQEEYFS